MKAGGRSFIGSLAGTLRKIGKPWLPGLLVLVALLLVYSGTLQRDVNGSWYDYGLDVGEFQVALNQWGTAHYTGYPLYTILSALLTHGMRIAGLTPAGAASAASTVWSLLALALVYRLVARVTEGERILAALVVLVLGLVESFWVHSVVAEVYSFGLFLTAAVPLLAIDLAGRWEDRRWWLMVALLGVGAEHHRLLLLLVPTALLVVLPALRERRPRWPAFVALSVVVFLLPFLAYLYLPLRALQGAGWVYGQPGTWVGFWDQFSGREMTPYVLTWPSGLAAWLDNLKVLFDQLPRQVPIGVLLAGGVGLLWMAKRRSPWIALGLLVGTCGFMAFVVVFPAGVWVPAVLMPSLLFLGIGFAYLLDRLQRLLPLARWAVRAGLVGLGLWLFHANLPFVHGLVSDPQGRAIIDALRPLWDADLPGGRDVVALPWGGGYFAAGYGLYVTGELEGFELVDHRADFRSIVDQEGKVITPAFYLGYWDLDWWRERLGETHYSAAAPGVAMVSRDVLYEGIPARLGFDLGNGVRVRDAALVWEREDRLRLTVYWEAAGELEEDYSVAVHLVSRDPPRGGEDVLAQADALNPVSGWYPTSLWASGEVVRDDYALDVPPGMAPAAVRIAMYRVDQGGTFVNSDWLSLPVVDASP